LDLIPQIRIGKADNSPVNPHGDYVLYRMTAFRRVTWNYSMDRAWGPERPVFGKIRYMSSKNTLKKVRVTENRLISDKGSSEKP
jgi:hypothetical protein